MTPLTSQMHKIEPDKTLVIEILIKRGRNVDVHARECSACQCKVDLCLDWYR